jgi:hypothetical protein
MRVSARVGDNPSARRVPSMPSGRGGAGGDDLANERASRLFFFLRGSFWRHADIELPRHEGEILLAKERNHRAPPARWARPTPRTRVPFEPLAQ